MKNPQTPNIVFILADNLGWGELGCYGGGALRGAPTPRLDKLATEGLRCLNFNVESDCVPTRSALMTGRHPIRTGALQSVPAGMPQGLIPWEITLAQLISGKGYATACLGKWHLGDKEGRYPKDRGFDEWYGIPRTTNESMFTNSPGYDPEVAPLPYVMEGVKGQPAKNSHVYDLEARRRIDSELTAKTIEFMTRQAKAKKPFFAYVPLTHLHYPTLPHHDFAGKTGAGDFADSMHEMDFRVGEMIDAVDKLGLRDNTLFIFGSDNGPEFRRPWRGTAGPWTGTYHTSMEGALRVPFIFRWPGKIAAGEVTNEIVHITDLYPTLARVVGAEVPTDRVIDGVDQLDFFLGKQAKSNREGFVYYIKQELRAAKWRDWKMHMVLEREPNEGPNHLETPLVCNLTRDPKEETDVGNEFSWVRTPLRKMIHAFQESLKQNPPIPPGAPDDYVPGRKTGMTLALPPRSTKPRKRGITSMIDFGPDTFGWTGAPEGIRNLLAACADYIDFAKIYALNALLMPRETVKAAARTYRDFGVTPFAGGILFEYAWQKNDLDGLETLLADLDIGGLEISENYVALTPDQRARAIERFQKRGIYIKYEFGRKNPTAPLALEELGTIVEAVAQQGIEHVIVEQSDFDMLVAARADAIPALQAQSWFGRLLIEADPYRFPQQHAELIKTFGNEVNLANITPGQVLRLEGFRRGIGRGVDYSIIER